MNVDGLRVGLVCCLVALVSLPGCGDDDEAAGGGTSGAVAKCQTFAHTWCEHVLTCSVSVGRLVQSEYQVNYDTCVRVAEAGIPCDSAVSVTSSYDACLVDVRAVPCATWDVPLEQMSTITPPSTCMGTILVQ